jgi:hypothetical protein
MRQLKGPPVTIALFETGKRGLSRISRSKVLGALQEAGVTFNERTPVKQSQSKR